MRNITKWWLDYMPLTDTEHKLVNTFKSEFPLLSTDEEFDDVEKEYFSRMPLCNISEKTHHITFADCATDFINELFEKYVDDETLVIHSNNEHDNVKKNLENCKHTLEVDYYNEIKPLKVFNIIKEAKKYKKVFVYIIGTQISTGEITPQIFFEKLKQQLVLNDIKHTIVLDDVHGMFLIPRDYSLFDYILYTAHALITEFGMGIMISKDKAFGTQAINWGKEYLPVLDIILNRKEKIRLFTQVIRDEFYEDILNNKLSLCDYTATHILSLKTHNIKFTQQLYQTLKDLSIRIEGIDAPNTYIRFRCQHYIVHPEYLIKGLELVHNILDNNEYM